MVDKEIKKIILHKSSFSENPKSKEASEEKKVFSRFRLGKIKYILIPLIILIFILAVIIVPTIILAKPLISSAKKTYDLAQEAYKAGKNQDLIAAGEKLKETEDSLTETKTRYEKMAWLKIVPFFKSYYLDGERGFSAGINGIQSARILVDAITPYADVLGFQGQGSFTGGSAEERIVKIVQTLDKVTPKIGEVAEKLALAQADLDKIDPERYPESFKGSEIRSKIVKAKSALDEVVVGVTETRPILNVLPKILGYPNSKKYLIIFQNDGELRATGGFMTAFSVLHLESGKLRSEKSDDIYSLDRKFKKRLPAPEPIEKYLFSSDTGSKIVPYFYMRDMNFCPDFKVSMETFKKYYDDLEGEYEVDGIIAMDTYVLRDLISILGPVEVPGYGKFTVEPDDRCHGIPNIICELEYIVDEPLPSHVGNRKQNILGPMMQQIMLKAMGSPKQLWPQLFSQILSFLKEKHVLFYFDQEDLQGAVEAYGAAGRIKNFDGDYLHINDSNFGGAKSNLFTKHELEQDIEISEDGTAIKTLTLTYENPEEMDDCNLERKSGLCLNSILRNYLRIYVPKGSKLIEALGSEVEMETKEELDKTYFEGFLTVRGGGGRAKMVIKYELPFKIKPGDNYQLLIQKQPGTLGHKYKIIFGDNEEEFDLRSDREFEFEF
jgi:hypothetical protein